jgi:hypothetical protein
MPEYSHVQTYVPCNQYNFNEVISQFVRMLKKVGFDKSFIEESFNGLEWEVCDDGFMYVGCNAEAQLINFNNVSLSIRPFIMGWTPEVLTHLSVPWLEICLLFETEDLVIDYATFNLREEVKKPIWETMNLMSQYFHETGTYFTDEISDGHPWEALIGEHTDFYSFDAAIIPNKYNRFFNNILEPFIFKVNEENLLIINKSIWGKEPWN